MKNSDKSDMSRYDLEQEIMECWSIVDDIRTLQWGMLDSYEGMSEDDIVNTLIGLEYLYEVKFTKLFNTYEQRLKNEKSNP